MTNNKQDQQFYIVLSTEQIEGLLLILENSTFDSEFNYMENIQHQLRAIKERNPKNFSSIKS